MKLYPPPKVDEPQGGGNNRIINQTSTWYSPSKYISTNYTCRTLNYGTYIDYNKTLAIDSLMG